MSSQSTNKHVAVIGSGPSGLAAVKALTDEKKFDVIRVFERRDRIGGTWLYDEEPDSFPTGDLSNTRPPPPTIPNFHPPAPEDTTRRSGVYGELDSNVGAAIMAFTYKPFPEVNSALSTDKFGKANPTRPYQVVAGYLEDLFTKYLHLVTFNTTLEKLEKDKGKWTLTLRRSGVLYRGKQEDYWWTETFDAVVVATGHYAVPEVPNIPGIQEFRKKYPSVLEHSKSFRSRNDFVGKKVIVVGGNVSASDAVIDLYSIVKGPLILSQRGSNPKLENVWKIPNLELKPTISRLSTEGNGTVEFSDGTKVTDVDKILFATGYRLSYPFIIPNPVTKENRLTGFYQHVFKIGDPSLAVVGQVRGALSFRVYEYQAVAAARVIAGRAKLPSEEEQKDWEKKRLEYKGDSTRFHEVAPDFAEYFNWLREIAGPPEQGTDGYELPLYDPEWESKGLEILRLKDEYVRSLHPPPKKAGLKAKL